MKLIYISHPYTGKETKNRKEAEVITTGLSQVRHDIVFVNPLNAFRHMKKAKIGYEETIAQCLALLDKCDGIIMAGDWRESYGCNQERDHAKAKGMDVWDSPNEFMADDVMPNDCCENHPCCWECYCRICAERRSCWNCNDCVLDKTSQRGVGFTGKRNGRVACSRFHRKDDTR